ncbi:MAG TPA: MASE1 domain-containing protein, partial [Solirubrobacter sp.]|nr:MASE1 domain-containing protein [Solirubrobacter sp.]
MNDRDGVTRLGALIGRGSSSPGGVVLGSLAVGAGYYALAKLGSVVQFTGGGQVAWLPVGFAAALLYLGDLRWLLGVAIADVLIGTGVVPFHADSLTRWTQLQTLGNVVELALIALLMRRWLGRRNRLERPIDVAHLLLAVACGTAISAAVGTLTGWGAGDFGESELGSVFRTWWLGDACGALLVAPLILVWVAGPPLAWPRGRKLFEAVTIPAAVTALSVAAFASHHPLPYIVLPTLVLAAINLGQRGATVALLLAVAVAIARTADQAGPFATSSIDDATLNTQLYVLVAIITTLALGAVVSSRREAALRLAESRRREAERAAEERRRIAGELHDSVSQTLFTLGLHTGIARHHAAHADLTAGEALRATLDEVAELANRALLEMRASIFELRRDALAEQGLVAALQAHAGAIALRHDVDVAVTGPDDRLPLDVAVEERLYRIAQEAITNAVKHSGSPSVAARLDLDPTAVRLEVRDAGVGFDPRRTYDGHIGLELMRARAAEAGARLSIDQRARPRDGADRHRRYQSADPSPSRTASSAACVRDVTPSLP